jgi:hypothetical protein
MSSRPCTVSTALIQVVALKHGAFENGVNAFTGKPVGRQIRENRPGGGLELRDFA